MQTFIILLELYNNNNLFFILLTRKLCWQCNILFPLIYGNIILLGAWILFFSFCVFFLHPDKIFQLFFNWYTFHLDISLCFLALTFSFLFLPPPYKNQPFMSNIKLKHLAWPWRNGTQHPEKKKNGSLACPPCLTFQFEDIPTYKYPYKGGHAFKGYASSNN